MIQKIELFKKSRCTWKKIFRTPVEYSTVLEYSMKCKNFPKMAYFCLKNGKIGYEYYFWLILGPEYDIFLILGAFKHK